MDDLPLGPLGPLGPVARDQGGTSGQGPRGDQWPGPKGGTSGQGPGPGPGTRAQGPGLEPGPRALGLGPGPRAPGLGPGPRARAWDQALGLPQGPPSTAQQHTGGPRAPRAPRTPRAPPAPRAHKKSKFPADRHLFSLSWAAALWGAPPVQFTLVGVHENHILCRYNRNSAMPYLGDRARFWNIS